MKLFPLFIWAAFGVSTATNAAEFSSDWAGKNERVWIGPEYWANPLQDWRLTGDGRVECVRAAANRSLFLLTHSAGENDGTFSASVEIERLEGTSAASWGGLRLGIVGTLPDYRNAAIHGKPGLEVGVRGDGAFFAGPQVKVPNATDFNGPVRLHLHGQLGDPGKYEIEVTLTTGGGKELKRSFTVPSDQVTGHLALVSHGAGGAGGGDSGKRGKKLAGAGQPARFAFRDWQMEGTKLAAHPKRTFGPVFWTQYTLSKGTLKMTAYLPPLGDEDADSVVLETKSASGWNAAARETIDSLSRTATFRIEKWAANRDVPYRVLYQLDGKTHSWTGTIREDPVDEEELSVAGFTGNTDYLFPNATLARNIGVHDPDVLFFSGDQIYESVGGFGFVREPVDIAALDYLRKRRLFGWAFGDLMRDRPSITLPDDHDVYQGNIWGHNGRQAIVSGFNDGGFGMDPEWVNMVNRTQTAHLPDPHDATPMHGGISVYYTGMTYGGVSFAIIEDRKFKSGPGAILPAKRGRADHVRPEDVDEATFDPLELDVPEARLLGERQLDFIRDWSQDWKDAYFKCAVSQTIFANLANFHGSKQEYLVADLDSNGWPQAGRNRALHELRKGYAFMYAGDQHLSSIVHHGINEFADAGVSFCVPSIAAGYPRAWRPEQPWPGHENGAPDFTGHFKEGLGNRVTVHAIGNPEAEVRRDHPEHQGHDKASGYGIVRFHRPERTITIECWRLLIDAGNPKPGDQFPGWPRTIALEDNYGRAAMAHLPTIKVSGMNDPVVQVVNETFGDIVYTLRIKGDSFRPKVFDRNANYTVTVGEPAGGNTKTRTKIRSTDAGDATLDFNFNP